MIIASLTAPSSLVCSRICCSAYCEEAFVILASSGRITPSPQSPTDGSDSWGKGHKHIPSDIFRGIVLGRSSRFWPVRNLRRDEGLPARYEMAKKYPVEGECTSCVAVRFQVRSTTHRLTLEEYQQMLQREFARHFERVHSVRTPAGLLRGSFGKGSEEIGRRGYNSLSIKHKELTPKQIMSVRCTTCGAKSGATCNLANGQPRTEPHRERVWFVSDKHQSK